MIKKLFSPTLLGYAQGLAAIRVFCRTSQVCTRLCCLQEKRELKMSFKKIAVIFFFVLPFSIAAQVNSPPFWDEIKNFKKADSINFPKPNQILFVGSSSFRLWDNLQSYFPGYPIINRGFGGSTLKDIDYYFKDIIQPYHARQIVIYAGDNDFAQDETLPPDSVVMRIKKLIDKIRAADKKVPILYVSIKPSPSRKKFAAKFIDANEKIKNYLNSQKNTFFIDVYRLMVDANGAPLKYIFNQDSLHMNAQGYAIWQKQIMPHLKKK